MEAGDPRVTICNAVHKNNIDLLILGHESHGILKRLNFFYLSHEKLVHIIHGPQVNRAISSISIPYRYSSISSIYHFLLMIFS